ncbi:MAG: hypothetical protein IKJ13_01560 [Clostridia bacterium]|nr:hypothetical protein [Clostridia bacterium]
MFSSKSLKLFVFAVSFIIILSAFTVLGGASEEAYPEIIGKNIVYTDKTALRFAVSPIAVDKNDIKLILTKPDGTEKIISSYEESDVAINGVDGALIFTMEGVPASAVCDEYTVVVKSGGRESEPLKYSVAEYFFERLYSDGIINASFDNALAIRQKSLYLDYLAYAESSQELFRNYYGEQGITLVSDYSFIGGANAVFANGKDSMLSSGSFYTAVTADETLSSDKRFLNKWTVTYYGDEITTASVENGDTVEVLGIISVSPAYTDAKGDYYLSDEAGRRVDYDTLTDIASGDTVYSGSTGKFEIADGALHFEDGSAESKEMSAKYSLSYPASYNVTVFEFDFKLNQAVSSYPIQIKMAKQTYPVFYKNTYDESYGTGYKLCMNVGSEYVPLGTPVGQWSTIRFEHYYDKAVLKVFVNNEFVFDIATNKGSEGTPEICLTSNERGADSDADLYVDNVYVGHLTKTFVKGDPK